MTPHSNPWPPGSCTFTQPRAVELLRRLDWIGGAAGRALSSQRAGSSEGRKGFQLNPHFPA